MDASCVVERREMRSVATWVFPRPRASAGDEDINFERPRRATHTSTSRRDRAAAPRPPLHGHRSKSPVGSLAANTPLEDEDGVHGVHPVGPAALRSDPEQDEASGERRDALRTSGAALVLPHQRRKRQRPDEYRARGQAAGILGHPAVVRGQRRDLAGAEDGCRDDAHAVWGHDPGVRGHRERGRDRR